MANEVLPSMRGEAAASACTCVLIVDIDNSYHWGNAL